MNTRNESDEWLMGQVRLGSRDSLEKLVRRYASPLLTLIERMVGNRHRGEELFQDVFLSVWIKRRQYKLHRPFRSWLYTIAANRCREDLRKRSPQTVNSANVVSIAAGDGSPVQTAIATETASLVETAVSRLPGHQRMTVVLRVWNQMTYREIADVVGITESTARSNMHRGLAAMKQYLEPRL